MDTSVTNSRSSLAVARRAEADWALLTTRDRVRFLELEGYVVLPQVLDVDLLEDLREECDRVDTNALDYSEFQRTANELEYRADLPKVVGLLAHPPVIDFFRELFGDQVICTSYTYGLSRPGHPGIVLHADAQPYGSKFPANTSSPVLVRVLYYLDELTPERSPFKVVPRSQLSLHADANPSQRYLSHPDEVMVSCPAGAAVIINQRVFHGNYPNYSDSDRRLLAISYRPAWAGPIGEIEERDEERVAAMSDEVKPFLASLNTHRIEFDGSNRPEGMPSKAHGISPARWGDHPARG